MSDWTPALPLVREHGSDCPGHGCVISRHVRTGGVPPYEFTAPLFQPEYPAFMCLPLSDHPARTQISDGDMAFLVSRVQQRIIVAERYRRERCRV